MDTIDAWYPLDVEVQFLNFVSFLGILSGILGKKTQSSQYLDFEELLKEKISKTYPHTTACLCVHCTLIEMIDEIFNKEVKKLKIPSHQAGTYWCIEGPRFSTRAESKFFRNFADIIGMTLCPEAALARESEICPLNFVSKSPKTQRAFRGFFIV